MQRLAEIEARLQRWAQWLKVGDGSGYPVKSTLHEDWSPPAPGVRPSMKVSSASREILITDTAVRMLSQAKLATVVAVYVLRMPAADAAKALACEPDTVHKRVATIHHDLARMLGLSGSSAITDTGLCNVQLMG